MTMLVFKLMYYMYSILVLLIHVYMYTYMHVHVQKMADGSRCCGCNRRGRCVSCSCVKVGRSCFSCLPKHNGHCENFSVQFVAPITPEADSRYSQYQPSTCCYFKHIFIYFFPFTTTIHQL